MSYNGWSNRETWLISAWYNPETKDDVQYYKQVFEDQYYDLPDGPLKDMVDINAINWQELEDAVEVDDEN